MGAVSLPILTYHSIDDTGSVISVAPGLFARQMAFLAAEGYQTLSFAEVVAHLRHGIPFPEKHVALTFDDGYQNVYTEAFPVLQAYGFTATVFLIVDYCGGFNDWPGHVSPVGRLPLMSWAEAQEMQQHGIELGAHTCTHPHLTALPHEQVQAEMQRSKQAIEDHTGAAVRTFAYPYGAYDATVRDLAASLFEGACTTRLGEARASANGHALPRIDMYYFQKPTLCFATPPPFRTGYLALRQLLRDFKSMMTSTRS